MNAMVYVQLGWLQTAVNWVYSHALKPLFDVVSNVFATIQKGLFEYVLLPILETALSRQIEILKALVLNILYNWLFRLTRVVMWALDAVENSFRTFAGLNPVYVQNANGAMEKKSSLLLAMVTSNGFIGAMLGMILIGFTLCFLTSLFATIRSMGDFGGEDGRKNSVGKVLRLTGNAMLRLILIPLMALFLVTLGDAVMHAIENATNSDHVAVSDILFTMSTMDAVRDDVPDGDSRFYNSSTRTAAMAGMKTKQASQYADYGLKDKYRKDYYLGKPVDGVMGTVKEFLGSGDTKKRSVMTEVLKTFDIRRIDYFIAIGGTILFIYLFGTMAISMISRILDCLLLLCVEPFFAAMMPIDEGKKFDTWQQVFLGRLISGYGMIVGVNVYLKVIGLIFEGKVAFFGEGTTPAVDYITRLLFVLMGAYAITQAGPLVTGIMNSQAGAREKEMNSQGAQMQRAMMGAAVALPKAVAGSMWKIGTEAAKDKAVSFFKSNSITGGGNPQPGIGDAFGTPGSKNGPTGVQFGGKKVDGGGGTVKQTGTGLGSTGIGTGGTAFSGKKGEPGSTPTAGAAGNVGTEGLLGTGGLAPSDGGSGQQFTQTNKPNTRQDPLDGLDAPLDLGKPGAFDFMNQPGDQNQEYTWIGMRDQEEREEKKKYEELLGSQLDDIAMNAAESETGMDLNGDGTIGGNGMDDDFIIGSINDGDDLSMQDIVGEDPDQRDEVDPFAEMFKKKDENPVDSLFGDDDPKT